MKSSDEKQDGPSQRIHAHCHSVLSAEIPSTAEPQGVSAEAPLCLIQLGPLLHVEVSCYSMVKELFHSTWTFYTVNHMYFYSFILLIHLPRPNTKAAFAEFSFW